MRLNLSQGSPVGKELSGNLPPRGNASLKIDGVTAFMQQHTTIIAFEGPIAMRTAAALTGWPVHNVHQLMLEAATTDGVGRLAIIANGFAYQSYSLEAEPDTSLQTFLGVDKDFNVPGPLDGGPERSGINLEGFTNGPWHVEVLEGHAHSLAICAEGDAACIVAEIHREDDGLRKVDYADAAMLAAAPDMRKRLQQANRLLERALVIFEDEEDSVKEEHADFIDALREYHA